MRRSWWLDSSGYDLWHEDISITPHPLPSSRHCSVALMDRSWSLVRWIFEWMWDRNITVIHTWYRSRAAVNYIFELFDVYSDSGSVGASGMLATVQRLYLTHAIMDCCLFWTTRNTTRWPPPRDGLQPANLYEIHSFRESHPSLLLFIYLILLFARSVFSRVPLDCIDADLSLSLSLALEPVSKWLQCLMGCNCANVTTRNKLVICRQDSILVCALLLHLRRSFFCCYYFMFFLQFFSSCSWGGVRCSYVKRCRVSHLSIAQR